MNGKNGGEESDGEASRDTTATEGERDNSSAALASVRLPPSSYRPVFSASDHSPPRQFEPPVVRRHRRQISSVAYDGHYIVGDRDRR